MYANNTMSGLKRQIRTLHLHWADRLSQAISDGCIYARKSLIYATLDVSLGF